jgi:[protein-PII] uridylyltransferase
LYRQFQRWRSRTASPDFSIVEGQLYLQNPAWANDPELILRAFESIAAHEIQFSSDAEARIERALPEFNGNKPQPEVLGNSLGAILKSPHAAQALRTMHELGFLSCLVPEFQLIDSLVVRDFYHRYTVDEHTFTAIDNLHRLPSRENEYEKRFSELLIQVEHPEVLYLALLFHDLGKGMPSDRHAAASVEMARAALGRLGLDAESTETVLFLIGNHLEMSWAMRRDIFDPENVRALAAKVGTLERLRLLCLMTYADIRAVNPEALTPWKAENLWRLFAAASNQLNRGIDDDLIHATAEGEQVQRLRNLIPNRTRQLESFLEGLPRRYLLSHTSDQIAVHFDMSLRLGREPVVVALKLSQDMHELSVVTMDRPFLFARIAGALAAWGMNIVRANAFSNAAAVVVDSFHFKDRFRTLELNPSERDRFKRSIADVLIERVDLVELMQRRGNTVKKPKVETSPRITLDNDSSSHSTLLEVVTADKPGLLYEIAEAISEQGCNIELALIDTEGQTAIDVFYVTRNRKKLSTPKERSFRKAIVEAIAD